MQKKGNRKKPSTHYVTVYEATQESGMSERSIRRWIAQGKVDAMQDKNRHVHVALDEVLALAKSSGGQSPLHLQVRELTHSLARLEERLDQIVERIERLEQGAPSRTGRKAQRDVYSEVQWMLPPSVGCQKEPSAWSILPRRIISHPIN